METLSRHYVACRDSVTKILKIFLMKNKSNLRKSFQLGLYKILTQSGEVRIDEHIWFPLEQPTFCKIINFFKAVAKVELTELFLYI